MIEIKSITSEHFSCKNEN